METKRMGASEGIRYVCSMIKAKGLADEMGMSNSNITNGINHNICNGKPYWFTQNVVEQMNVAIGRISGVLRRMHITLADDTPEQMKAVDKYISMTYIFIERMQKKNRHWYQNRIVHPVCKFKQDDIDRVNEIIQDVASSIEVVVLEYESPDGEVVSTDTANTADLTPADTAIPFPPFQYDYPSFGEYVDAWDAWEAKYKPTDEQKKELNSQLFKSRGVQMY